MEIDKFELQTAGVELCTSEGVPCMEQVAICTVRTVLFKMVLVGELWR